MENIELAVNGSREEVTEMLKNENDVDSLVILVATLKKLVRNKFIIGECLYPYF